MASFRSTIVLLAALSTGCADTATEPTGRDPDPDNATAQRDDLLRAEARAQALAERNACESMRANVDAVPALAGAPVLEEQRHRVLGRTKGTPVVFRRVPLRDTAVLMPYFQALAESLNDPRRVHATLKTLRSQARYRRDQVRAILLPEGYFYADEPTLARWLELHITLDRLFDEPEIWMLRGSDVVRLTRSERGYRYADGPEEGDLASLLLFDRVSVDRALLFPALHMDFAPAARSHGFDRIRVERITPIGINAQVRYGPDGPWVPAVFTSDAARAQLACSIASEEDKPRIDAFRAEQRLREHVSGLLHAAAAQEARELLPFDEPREEVGQQDGSLRPLWEWAYFHGGLGYSFNEVWYPVFDTKGRPHPPQVCIDFILDTYERAAGTWFQGREAPRERTTGRLNVAAFEMPNRRSVEAVVDYFRENPGVFDVWDLEQEERIRFQARNDFFDFVRDHADRFRVNDVVLIHGPRGGEAHYHSFFVTETDPVTGMPVVLAENAGKPRFRSWESAMQNAPLRSIKQVMTPRLDWLQRTYGGNTTTVAVEARPSVSR